MRLISVQLRNYRIHRELDVMFDRERTMVGGPNEVGKSTLAEAVHRALFLKAKGNTELHRAMVSEIHGGEPSVDLAFEAEGGTWTLRKRFSGKGSTTLARENGQSLTGEQAEAELARLLRVQPGATRNAVHTQWEHLWVWQGTACDNPTEHATTLREDLLQRLQTFGAASVLQSELDAEVAARFAAHRNATFTTQDKPKAGSPLDLAERAAAEARQAKELATSRLSTLEGAALKLESAEAQLPEVRASLVTIEQEQGKLDERAANLAELQRREVTEVQTAKGTTDRLSALQSADEKIHKLEVACRKRGEALAPLQRQLSESKDAFSSAKGAAVGAERAYENAVEAGRNARLQLDLAQAHRRIFELRSEAESLSVRRQRIQIHQEERSALDRERNQLPDLSEAKLKKFQKLELDCEKARVAVATMSTGIEVIRTSEPISVDGEVLEPSVQKTIATDAVLRIGESVEIRIYPGGGGTLADARQRLSESEKALLVALDAFALKSVVEASALCAQRQQVIAKIAAMDAQLAGLDPEGLEERLVSVTEQLGSEEARVGRLSEVVVLTDLPKEAAGAAEIVRAFEIIAKDTEDAERMAKAQRDASADRLRKVESEFAQRQEAWDRDSRELEGMRVELRVLIEAHGVENARAEAVLTAETECKSAKAKCEALQTQIADLQPELLEADRLRIKRSSAAMQERRSELQNAIAGAQALLRSEGAEDPRATMAVAEARLKAAEENLSHARLKANAFDLLHRCFQEEQQALAEQYTRPLAEKISAYLQCLFGASARASVELNAEGFEGLKISRGGGGTYEFGVLSGGAREQTAAAVRLALAEVLAADHDGSLPVIFDDAFAYSDPDRVQRLQRMLDLAANRGLQVIVLTCNPADYAALGAKPIILKREGV